MLTTATVVVVAASATFAAATTFAIAFAATATAATAFARHHLDEAGNFGISGFAGRNYAALEMEFFACQGMVKVDDYYFFLHFQNKTLEAIAVGIYEGDYGAFENNVLLETTVEHEGRFGKFDNVFLFVGTISFVHAEREIKLITCVEVLEFCFKRFERHTEFGDKLERMLHGSLFYEFVNTFCIICVKAVSHCNVLVHSVKLLCVGVSKYLMGLVFWIF
jgi:hypothetical protein